MNGHISPRRLIAAVVREGSWGFWGGGTGHILKRKLCSFEGKLHEINPPHTKTFSKGVFQLFSGTKLGIAYCS